MFAKPGLAYGPKWTASSCKSQTVVIFTHIQMTCDYNLRWLVNRSESNIYKMKILSQVISRFSQDLLNFTQILFSEYGSQSGQNECQTFERHCSLSRDKDLYLSVTYLIVDGLIKSLSHYLKEEWDWTLQANRQFRVPSKFSGLWIRILTIDNCRWQF